jgi:uncharacterized protein (TIGR00369 family)
MTDTIDTPDGFEPLGQDGTFLDHVGGLLWRRLPDRTDTCVLVQAHHANPNGTAHGGLLMTLLDITLGATAESFLGIRADGRHPATIQLSCSFLQAAATGHWLFGEARVERATRTLTFVSGRLHTGGETVLTASAVFRNPSPAPAPATPPLKP